MTYEIIDYESLRRAVDALCAFLSEENVSSDCVFDSKLVAYEVLGNVLKHAKGNATFAFALANGFVELTVLSEENGCPCEKGRCSGVYAESGRGLFLVDSVAERSTSEDGRMRIRIKLV